MLKLQPPEVVIPAATAIVFRHGRDGGAPEILIVKRATEMRFAGGAAVFPGGRVDPADRELAARLAPEVDPVVTAARVAAMRETLEETGLAIAVRKIVSAAEAAAARAMLLDTGDLSPVLNKFGWVLDLERLVPFARWCPDHIRAFDTLFFLADLGTGEVEIEVDQTENTHLFWASAARTLELADAGELSIMFPTRRNLERVAQFSTFAEATAHADRIPVTKITPYLEERDGDTWLMIPEGRGYPVRGQLASTVF